ncbi:hypothetical protein [Hyperthermus butylicus]|nr:hypothetical protein [Hyperthermus butylicus]
MKAVPADINADPKRLSTSSRPFKATVLSALKLAELLAKMPNHR